MKRYIFLTLLVFLFIFTFEGSSQAQGSWEKIKGKTKTAILGLEQVDNETVIYTLEPNKGDIYLYNGNPFNWTKVGGPGKSFVVAGPGYLCALSPDGTAVYQYTGTPMKWKKIGGAAGEIYGGPNGLYATNPKTGDLWHYNFVSSKWTKIGGPGKMFAVGNSGHLYGLSKDGSEVYRFTGTPMKWTKIGGAAGHIYAGGKELFSSDPKTGEIWRYKGSPNKWQKIGGPGKMFSVDDKGRLYGLATDSSGVFQYEGTPMKWKKIGGAMTSIFAGGNSIGASSAATGELLLYKPLTKEYIPGYDINLIIITHEDFLTSLNPLKKHKNATGITTLMVSWQSLVKKFPGKDTPEKIKKGIADYKKKHNVKYVMLVGDSDKFPVRYVCRDVPYAKGYQANDLYYADLFKSDGSFDTWDGNGNNLYAQIDGTLTNNNVDKVDWHPDVAIARVPASTVTEVQNYVEKVISYEQKTANSTWFKKALLLTGDKSMPGAIKVNDFIAANYLSGFAPIKYYYTTFETLYPVNPKDVPGSMDKRAKPITDHINKGVGFVTYYGHGSWDDFCWVYDKRHLNDLTNTDKLPVIFSRGCQNGEFAPSPPWQSFYDVYGVYHPGKNATGEKVPRPKSIQPGQGQTHDCDLEARPEDWLVYRKTGAVAFIGCAGTANPYYADNLMRDFFNAYKEGKRTFGDMWLYMVQRFLDEYGFFDKQGNTVGKNDWERHVVWNSLLRFNAFGDPSLRVGGISGK